jgi:isopenicillin N synthase-like dioxygenase
MPCNCFSFRSKLKKTFAVGFNPPTAFLQLIRYPPLPPKESCNLFGSAPHRDFGCITIIAQDETEGLQVKNPQGKWIDAPFIKDSFVMNIGEMLYRWSNGLLISTPHRVINCSGQERYSCTFFFEPNVNVKVSPLTCCITHDQPKQFASVVYGEFLRSELQSGYNRHAINN